MPSDELRPVSGKNHFNDNYTDHELNKIACQAPSLHGMHRELGARELNGILSMILIRTYTNLNYKSSYNHNNKYTERRYE